MSIKKRTDGKWLVNVQPGGRTGHQVKRVFDTQREAKEFETWAKAQHHQDPDWSPTKPDNRRLTELIKTWFDAHGVGLRAGKNTKARLLAMAQKMGDPPPNQVRTRFDEYRQARIEEGKNLATINREHAYLRAVFNELKRLGQWTKDNPIRDVRQFKINERELSFLTLAQIAELFDELKNSTNPHAYLIAKIAISTGGRWGEVETLTKSQLQNLRIQFANTTKSGKARAVPISDELGQEIELHMSEHPTKTERIFESSYAAFLSALARTSIVLPDGQASHVLRHTFASHFMINGGNILTLQRVLGHASLVMTMRYAHLAPDHLQEVLTLNPIAQPKRRRKSVGSPQQAATEEIS
jgi:integrase